jgi:uncharacterized protein YndB with AHSA1/START domain
MLTEIFSTTPGCEIMSTRIFHFPIQLVYKAWSDATHLKNWWGPAGFTNSFEEFDFRVGGRWRFVMHGPEKGNYINECEFIKIETPNLIAWKRRTKPLFKVVASFEELSANETNLVFRMVFDTPEECDKIKKFAVDKNEENFDKLENELSKMSV